MDFTLLSENERELIEEFEEIEQVSLTDFDKESLVNHNKKYFKKFLRRNNIDPSNGRCLW